MQDLLPRRAGEHLEHGPDRLGRTELREQTHRVDRWPALRGGVTRSQLLVVEDRQEARNGLAPEGEDLGTELGGELLSRGAELFDGVHEGAT